MSKIPHNPTYVKGLAQGQLGLFHPPAPPGPLPGGWSGGFKDLLEEQRAALYATAPHPISINRRDRPGSPRRVCGAWTYRGTRANGSLVLARAYCHSWDCPRCRERKIKRLKGLLVGRTYDQGWLLFYRGSYREASRAISLLVKRMRRKVRGLEYMALRAQEHEEHAIGMWVRGGIPMPKELLEEWAAVGGEPRVARILVGKHSNAGEKLQGFLDLINGSEFHERHFSMSRGFSREMGLPGLKGRKGEDIEWDLLPLPLERVKAYYLAQGYQVVQERGDWVELCPA